MSEANEMVTVELCKTDRVRLRYAVITQMMQLNYDSFAWESLDVGFPMPARWPAGEGPELSFSQLVVLARKLKMRIRIRELEMTPL